MANNYYENLGSIRESNENVPQEKNTPNVPPATSVEETPNVPEREDVNLPQENIDINNNTTETTPMAQNNSTGQLTVSVFTANQLYPVVGATVSVRAENGENNDILDSSDTDRSGVTKTFTLPAPSATMSQEPTVAIPFSEYRVTITSPDFFEAVIENVQVFGGIVTQLPVNLVPIPEIPNGETTKIVIIPRQNL